MSKRLKESDRVGVDFSRIARARKKRENDMIVWKENLRYYLGDQWSDIELGENEMQLTINKIFPFVRSQLPALMFSEPVAKVNSDRSSANPLETDSKQHLLNYLFRKDHGKYAVRMAITSAFIAYGAVKTGYTADFESRSDAGVFETDANGDLIVDRQDEEGNIIPKLKSGDFERDADGNILFDSDGLAIVKPDSVITNETFFVRWVPFSSLLFDPEGTNDFRTHRWIIEEWVRPTEDLKSDPLLKNVSKIEPSEFVKDMSDTEQNPMGIDISNVDEQFTKEAVLMDKGRTRGWTIYDFEKREIRTVVNAGQSGTGSPKLDRYVREVPMPPEMWDRGPKHGGPFHFLIFNDTPGQWPGITDVEILLPLQDEINMQRSKISTHIRRADRKFLYQEGFMEDSREWNKLLAGGDMSFAKVSDLNAVRALEQAPMDTALFTALPSTNADFDELGGSGETRGVARADSATQAAVLENRQQVRESDRRDNQIHDFLVSIYSGLLKSIQANMTMQLNVKVADPKFPDAYLFNGTVSPEDIDGDFNISVDVSSLQPRTNPVYRQQVLSLLQQFIVPMMSNPFALQFLTPSLLDELFEIYELGNTQIADEIGKIAQKLGAQIQQQQTSPDQSTGQQGALSSGLAAGGTNGIGAPSSRTQ